MSNHAPLVADKQFLVATRDTGYRDVAAAVAELVDNSVQAGATEVHIAVLSGAVEASLRSPESKLSVAVLDNGCGIVPGKLQEAIQFGGTDRFDNRNGLGRFGMGLPNSSVSVARRLEVYSWRDWNRILHTYIDVTEVSQGVLAGIPRPTHRPLPCWAVPLADRTGTLVVWSDCDRLGYKRAAALASGLHRKLGQVYRRLIWSGLRISINEKPVAAIDPLMCHPLSGDGGAKEYGPPLKFDLPCPNREGRSEVVVRFTELPVMAWHALTAQEKRARGLVGGAGVSFVRAEREIDYCWQLIGKRRENYDDWWRCEILFEPVLDEYFGVTNSKQGVNPIPYLRSIVEPELEAIARQLNSRARAAFTTVRRSAPSHVVGRVSHQDQLLPPLKGQHDPQRGTRGLTYSIVLDGLPSRAFFDVSQNGGHVTVTINTDHLFYDRLFAPATAAGAGNTRHALEYVLLAAGRARLAAANESCNWAEAFLNEWSDALAAFLETKGCRT